MKRIATRLSRRATSPPSRRGSSRRSAAEGPVARVVQPRAHAVRVRQPAMSRMRKRHAHRRSSRSSLVVGRRGRAVICCMPGYAAAAPPARPAAESQRRRSSTGASTWRAPATASPATPTPAGKQFAGGRAMPTPFGNLYVPNITPDDETGIGQWTADEFYRMMHTGISRDGTLLYPAMPFASYTKVTREDSDAIYAYLMSVPPVKPEEPAARAALPVQQARAADRLAHALLQGRRVRARPEASRRNGIAARTWSKASAIARCATPPSTRWAARASRRRSKAG